jgi:hypothetical protein
MNPRWQDLAEHLGSEVLFPGQTQGSLALMRNARAAKTQSRKESVS